MQCSLDRLIAPSFYKVHNSIEVIRIFGFAAVVGRLNQVL